ncbi:MAG: hypothetical protein AVDCRST_MAG27-3352, partial [uncultured Craurococcus sp.]
CHQGAAWRRPRSGIMSRLVLAILVAAVDAAAAGSGATMWWQHRALVLPIPMTVVGNQSI